MKNEQSIIILWVGWCKNKSFWQRFTCTEPKMPPFSTIQRTVLQRNTLWLVDRWAIFTIIRFSVRVIQIEVSKAQVPRAWLALLWNSELKTIIKLPSRCLSRSSISLSFSRLRLSITMKETGCNITIHSRWGRSFTTFINVIFFFSYKICYERTIFTHFSNDCNGQKN